MPNRFNIENLTVTNGAVINNGTITNTVNNNASPADAAILQELADAQSRLADSETLIADAIGELREALVQKDEKTIQQKMKALTSGTAAEVLKKVASAVVLRFLGLS
ncbi:MAG: hypothetical protein IJT94_06225 [Oscillibacter sp.]|nr:hypothetical protein [Oscillibacter sp.]